MLFDDGYQCDSEFVKLLTHDDSVNLTLLALELARDGQPGLNFSPTLDWIDARARQLAGRVAQAPTCYDALAELGEVLANEWLIHGSQNAFQTPDGSYLNRVIETGEGIPICLSVLYMAVAEKLGLELQGVAAPVHFLTSCETSEGRLFVDAFHNGRILNETQCINWLEELATLPKEQILPMLEPANPRTIVIRMLNNLKYLHLQQENWSAAWVVQHRLAALRPSCFEERRDLAIISLHANHPGLAIDLLESCLNCCPTEEKEVLSRHLCSARRQQAMWN